MIIVYKGANQHSVSAGPADRVVLNPGQNNVDADVWARIEKASEKDKNSKGGVKYLKESGLIVIGSDDEDLDVSKMKVKEAVEVIDTEADLEVLQKYLDQELESSRKSNTVIEAAETAIKIVTESGGGTGGDNGGAD